MSGRLMFYRLISNRLMSRGLMSGGLMFNRLISNRLTSGGLIIIINIYSYSRYTQTDITYMIGTSV